MATLAVAIQRQFPRYFGYFKTRSFRFKGRVYRNHNRLLGRYRGVNGIKTGYIRAAGFNLVSSVERDGKRLIGVVFGGRSGRSRDRQMVRLLDRGKRLRILAAVAAAAATSPADAYRPGGAGAGGAGGQRGEQGIKGGLCQRRAGDAGNRIRDRF